MTLERRILDAMRDRHSVVIGMTRSGKTTFVANALERLGAMSTHTLFVDPKHDDAFAKLGKVCYTPIEVYEQLLLKQKNIVYRPPGSDERREGLDRVIELLFGLHKSPGFKRVRRVIAIDEIQLFVKKGGSKAVEMIWTIGAGMGITGIAMTQRMQLLNETCWSQSDNKFIFRIEDRAEYLKSRNLDHFITQQEFFNDEMNKYWFYFTTGGGKWKTHKPVSINKPKSRRRLSLSRW